MILLIILPFICWYLYDKEIKKFKINRNESFNPSGDFIINGNRTVPMSRDIWLPTLNNGEAPSILPISTRVAARTIGNDLIPVRPMTNTRIRFINE